MRRDSPFFLKKVPRDYVICYIKNMNNYNMVRQKTEVYMDKTTPVVAKSYDGGALGDDFGLKEFIEENRHPQDGCVTLSNIFMQEKQTSDKGHHT